SRRTQSGLSVRSLPAGAIFGDKGPSIFADIPDLLVLLAIANSEAFRFLVSLQMAFGSYEVGVIQRTPVPRFGDVERHRLKEVGRVFEIRRSLDTTNEVSHVFCLPAILRVSGTTLTSRSETWRRENDKRLAEVSSLTASINDTVTNLYGLEPVDLSRWRNGENLSLDEDSDPDEQEEKFESDHDDQGNPREYVSAL